MPKQFWVISIVALVVGTIVVINPIENWTFLSWLNILIMAEIIRVIVIAITKKREGVWIIGLAFLVFYFFGTFDALMDAGIIVPFEEMKNPYVFGSIGFFIAMSIYLSRDFARTNRKLAEKEIERKVLEVENNRKSKELEEARQLQLSMLPKDLPKLTNLEIDVFVKTATEVGGDYYDFKLHGDGSLTLVIGDATGHGMQAGTIVSATKSLFNVLADEPDIVSFLQKGTKAIKSMDLKKMFMALTIARFRNYNMQIAAAGMPYPLIYRSSTKQIEELIIKGMPLGGHVDFPYEEKNIKLHKGDTILLMSDGHEEMFNSRDEMLGKERTKKILEHVGGNSPKEIIEHLKRAGEEWADGRDQEDDVTFVVIKIK